MHVALRRVALVGFAACLCQTTVPRMASAQTPGSQNPSFQTHDSQIPSSESATPAASVPSPKATSVTVAADAEDAADAPPPDVASQVRIVRLSQVRGIASIERSAGGGFSSAFANIPIVTGTRLRTADGAAEVEFEDGSTLRLTPHSAVDFQQLGRSASGATISQMDVLDGSVYVSLARSSFAGGSLAGGKGSIFTLQSGKAQMGISPGTHLRLDVSAPGNSISTALGKPLDTIAAAQVQAVVPIPKPEPNASVAVFEGEVDFSNPAGHSTLTRKRTLSFDMNGADSPVLDAHIEQEPFDEWDKQGVQYQKRYRSAAYGGSGYGASDLNYYGSFVDLAGCGSVWRPYFVSAAWDPYDNGIWAWYGNAGYSWVSPYPWGWLPFHTGAWQFCGAGGWGWRPGGAWYGLQNRPRFFRPAIYGVKRPPQPPHQPAPGHPRLVAVNGRPLPIATLAPTGDFVFHKDSAGFGVPREGFHHLGRESAAVDRKGLATKSLDLERFSLPSSNRLPVAAWSGSAGANAGFANRAAWAAARSAGDPGSHGAGTAPGSAIRSAAPAGGWNGTPRESWGASGSVPASHTAPMGPSPSFHSAPAGSAPSFHSAPSGPSPSFHSAPAPAPAAAAARGK